MSTFGRIISIFNLVFFLCIVSLVVLINSSLGSLVLGISILVIAVVLPIAGFINSIIFYRNRKRPEFKPSRFDSFLAAIPIVNVAIMLFFIGSLIVYNLLN